MHLWKGSLLWAIFHSRDPTRMRMGTRARRRQAGGSTGSVDTWFFTTPALPSAPSPAHLPSEAMALAGRWCLGWRGSKGHCDRSHHSLTPRGAAHTPPQPSPLWPPLCLHVSPDPQSALCSPVSVSTCLSHLCLPISLPSPLSPSPPCFCFSSPHLSVSRSLLCGSLSLCSLPSTLALC